MVIAAARSVFRSSAVRNAATRLASQAKSAPASPFRLPSRTPLLVHRIFRYFYSFSFIEMRSIEPFADVIVELDL